MFSLEDGMILIKLARDSISSQFSNKELIVEDTIKKRFSDKQGCFVTLKLDNELRGCIGFPEPILPLYEAVVESAKSAAFSDLRFLPLKKEEFDKIKIEISVLTKPELIEVKGYKEYLEKIKIGKDGLIIRTNHGSGLLLPQVFIEYKVNVEQALQMTCQKAGLNSDAWKDIKNKIYKFQARIFAEENGKVIKRRE
jgi:hypothetical protein